MVLGPTGRWLTDGHLTERGEDSLRFGRVLLRRVKVVRFASTLPSRAWPTGQSLELVFLGAR
jgi:hypothetical protein